MSVALSIVFTGLCALVADGDGKPAQVLLVDAKGVGDVGGMELPAHAPTLVASLSALANAATSDPTRVITAWPERELAVSRTGRDRDRGAPASAHQIGIWDLTGSEVRIRVQGREAGGVSLYRPPAGASAWPEPPRRPTDADGWRDLRFIPSMKALTGDGRIDPALIAVDGSPLARLPRGVAARVVLDTGRLEAGPPTEDLHRGEVFEFRSAGMVPALRQAMTDTVRWSLDADATAVIVEIAPVAGGAVKRLVFNPSGASYDLFVSNLPTEDGFPDSPHVHAHETAAVVHFGAYYELLMHRPSNRPLPWIWTAPTERRGAGRGRPSFCGPALFDAH